MDAAHRLAARSGVASGACGVELLAARRCRTRYAVTASVGGSAGECAGARRALHDAAAGTGGGFHRSAPDRAG